MSIHEPLLFFCRTGAWSACLCGWTSGRPYFRSVFGAHLRFGEHLLDLVESERRSA